jgi:hypothetical protein
MQIRSTLHDNTGPAVRQEIETDCEDARTSGGKTGTPRAVEDGRRR